MIISVKVPTAFDLPHMYFDDGVDTKRSISNFRKLIQVFLSTQYPKDKIRVARKQDERVQFVDCERHINMNEYRVIIDWIDLLVSNSKDWIVYN